MDSTNLLIIDGIEYISQVKKKKKENTLLDYVKSKKEKINFKSYETLIQNNILENKPFNRVNSFIVKEKCQTYL